MPKETRRKRSAPNGTQPAKRAARLSLHLSHDGRLCPQQQCSRTRLQHRHLLVPPPPLPPPRPPASKPASCPLHRRRVRQPECRHLEFIRRLGRVTSGIPAGTTVGGTVEAERYGQVELNRQSGLFLGAEVGSNNTGELTGVCEALHYLIEMAAHLQRAAAATRLHLLRLELRGQPDGG